MSGDIIDLTMTDPADEQTHSEADLATIYDVMVWHQMPHFPARSLMQLNCERWSVWNPCHTARIIEARRLDDSRDWYFPLICKRWIPKPGEIVPHERCWTWSGIWHESADHAHTESALTLPPMTYLRQDWRYATFMLFHIAASEGGLLLLWSRREMIPKRPRVNKPEAESNVPDTSAPERSTMTESDYIEKHSSHWTRMLVCNPLTKEYRELPAANCEDMGRHVWQVGYYHGVQVRMVVDDEANSYQVMLLFKSFVAVYKSTTNSWNYLQFQKIRPWGRRFHPWVLYSAAVSVGARVYLADVKTDSPHLANPNARLAALRMDPVSDPTPVGTLRLFEVDAEAGTWHVRCQFTFLKFHLPVLNQYPEIVPFDMGVVDNVELVRCMGALFAILPARLHDVVTVEKKQTLRWSYELQNFDTGRRLKRKNRRSFELHDPNEMWAREVGVKYMPLMFYVMQLRSADGVFGNGVDHGVLRIDIPKTRNFRNFPDYIGRKQRMYDRTDVHRSGGPIWFKCEARGSVIWVSFEDYLLSYDVVSRQSTTRMIPVDSSSSTTDSPNHVVRLTYRPNFHMKP